MDIQVDNRPKNCNRCIYNQNVSRHWDLEDYCLLNKKSIGKIMIDRDCMLRELEDKKYEQSTRL